MNYKGKNHLNFGRTLFTLVVVQLLAFPVFADSPIQEETLSLKELINLPEKDLAHVDIATMNLAAAEGLPGSRKIDRVAVSKTIDDWANKVAIVTANKAHFFKSHPEFYGGSWAKFCSIMLVLTLQQDLGVHYNIEQRTNPSLAKSKDQFIHGIMNGTGGTCASLPVIFVAVGRRLGYPMRLAQTYSHYYARWDDPDSGQVFNIEGSNLGGLDFPGEDHYQEMLTKHWPNLPEAGNYLKSMSPREELSAFLTTRADCLRENNRWADAYHTYKKALELAPQNMFAAELFHATAKRIKRMQDDRVTEAAYQRIQRRRRNNPRLMIPGMPNVPSVHAFSNQPRQGVPRRTMPTNLNGTGWQPPTMQNYLNQTNSRNQQLMRFGQPGINRSNSVAFPRAHN